MNIIMYHYVRPVDTRYGKLRYLNLDQFKKQLDYFESKLGFLSKEEFVYNFENKIISEKVLLTFDDGLIDHYKYVFPILKQRGIKGLFFIPSSILNKKKLLNVHKIHYLIAKNDLKLIYRKAKEIIDENEIDTVSIIDKEVYSYSKHNDYELNIKSLFNYQLDYESSYMITDYLLQYFGLNHNFSKELYLNGNHIAEMFENGQIFGSHTVNHKILSTLDFKNQNLEIKNSFDELSNFIVKGFKTISYPFGYKFTYDHNTHRILENDKINYGFIFDNKKNNLFNKYEISRIDCNRFLNL